MQRKEVNKRRKELQLKVDAKCRKITDMLKKVSYLHCVD